MSCPDDTVPIAPATVWQPLPAARPHAAVAVEHLRDMLARSQAEVRRLGEENARLKAALQRLQPMV